MEHSDKLNNVKYVINIIINMASGKKERIMIACVTFEVAKVVEPAVFYESTKVHLVHYGGGLYEEFYDEVVRRLKEELPKAEIISHDDKKVYEFDSMMNVVLNIICEEQKAYVDPSIYVNVSAGTTEFTGAALIASMMRKNITPFNVPTEKYQVDEKLIKEIYYENGKPIGLTKTCREPNLLTTYTIQGPDSRLVKGLDILKSHSGNTSAQIIIDELAKKGMIEFSRTGKKFDQKTLMRYQRNYVDKWLENGWVERIGKRVLKITDEGESVLKIFVDSSDL